MTPGADGRVIVTKGTTVTINVTVRSDVIPEVSWIFTGLLSGMSGPLNTSNMTLYQTTNITVLEEELYQVCQMLTYSLLMFVHCSNTTTACTL